eukprot:15435809-Alexandrium_andersonii.AAC.1
MQQCRSFRGMRCASARIAHGEKHDSTCAPPVQILALDMRACQCVKQGTCQTSTRGYQWQ